MPPAPQAGTGGSRECVFPTPGSRRDGVTGPERAPAVPARFLARAAGKLDRKPQERPSRPKKQRIATLKTALLKQEKIHLRTADADFRYLLLCAAARPPLRAPRPKFPHCQGPRRGPPASPLTSQHRPRPLGRRTTAARRRPAPRAVPAGNCSPCGCERRSAAEHTSQQAARPPAARSWSLAG